MRIRKHTNRHAAQARGTWRRSSAMASLQRRAAEIKRKEGLPASVARDRIAKAAGYPNWRVAIRTLAEAHRLTGFDAFADDMYDRIDAAPSFLSTEQMAEVEDAFQSWGVSRRIAIAILTKSGHELIQSISRDRNFAVAMARWSEEIRAHLAYLNGIKQLISHAHARVLIALAGRTDMKEVLRQAREAS